MKKYLLLLFLATAAVAREPDIQLGVQAWTFRRGTFFEAVDKAASLDIHFIEAYPGQKLGGELAGNFHHTMDEPTRQKVLAKLKATGVTLVSYGVVAGKDEADWKQIFTFAKAMGLQNITSEPAPETLDLVAQLADQTGIRVALHNHPKPSRYWDPDIVLEAVKKRTPRLSACADTGHWVRSGLDPVACLKKLEGRIINLHFKDLDRPVKEAHDVPWGTGISNAAGQIAELKRQKFQGVVLVEYEHDTPALLDNVRRCVAWFKAATLLSARDLIDGKLIPPGMTYDVAKVWHDGKLEPGQWPEPPPEFAPLFQDDLSNATFTKDKWEVKDGVLAPTGKGDIWTKDTYGNFELLVEFKCDPTTNSGVFLRCSDLKNWLHTAIEVQILQPDDADKKHVCGAIFDCLAPTKQAVKPAGEWNSYKITAKNNKIKVELNGEKVVDMDLDQWTEAHKNPDGTPNKFAIAYKDLKREGHIGLQYHGAPVWFRKLKIKKL